MFAGFDPAFAIDATRLGCKREHRRLDLLRQRLGGGRRSRQHDQAEAVAMIVAGVIVVGIVSGSMIVVVVVVAMVMTVAMGMPVPGVGTVRMVMRVIVAVLRCRLGAGAQHVTARLERIDTRPLERILRLEEAGIHRQRAVQIEGADVQHFVDGHVGVPGTENLRGGIDRPDPALDALKRIRRHQIDLVEQDDVGERDLLARLLHLVEMLLEMQCVDHGDDRVERELLLEIVVEEEGLRDRPGIGHAGGLDDHVVETVATLQQLAEDAQQIAPHRAADAAVVGFEDLLFRADHELVIDADLTELVLDHGDPFAVVLRKDAIEQRGFARAQKSRQDGDGDPIRGSHRSHMIT